MVEVKTREQRSSEYQFQELTFENVATILGSTVKQDRTNKLVLFSSMLLTYTGEEQLVVLMAAESSAGKSYLPLELAAYFPDPDILLLGGASPTAFFHEVSGGNLATWDDEHKMCRVNLGNKIIVLLDQPHDQLLQKMRSFLSHDQKEIVYKIADRSQKAGLRTRTIVLVGFPTWIFCTAAFNLDQQERTRCLQLSPETEPGKITEAIRLLLEKKCNRNSFKQRLIEDQGRLMLRNRVLALKEAHVRDVIIPDPLREAIARQWFDSHSTTIPRHVRDLDRFLSLVKAHALLNFQLRPQETDNRIVAIEQDVLEVTAIYSKIAEANELGLAPQVYEIFTEAIAKFPGGTTKKQILAEYYAVFHRPLSTKRLEKEVLPSLEASGLLHEEKVPGSETMFYPHPSGSHLPEKQPTPQGVGVNESLENATLLHPEVPRD